MKYNRMIFMAVDNNGDVYEETASLLCKEDSEHLAIKEGVNFSEIKEFVLLPIKSQLIIDAIIENLSSYIDNNHVMTLEQTKGLVRSLKEL